MPVTDVNKDLLVHDRPMVCVFDVSEGVVDVLTGSGFNFVEETLGCSVKVRSSEGGREEKFLKLNHSIPRNLHEFDVVILDLTTEKIQDYNASDHGLDGERGAKANYIISRYPQQIFDPRPFAVNILNADVDGLLKKGAVIVVFCDNDHKSEYELVEVTSHRPQITGSHRFASFDFYKEVPHRENKKGTRVVLSDPGGTLSSLLQKYIDSLSYGLIFSHPKLWDGRNHVLSDKFVPLLENGSGEIVSYIQQCGEGLVFVFPNIKDKPGFMSDLLNVGLPSIVPELFPFHGQFGWLDNGDYLLPGEEALHNKKHEVQRKYEADISQIESEIVEVKASYSFLHDLLVQTGDGLVSAVKEYMEWLGFENVVDMDDSDSGVLEEDLQIETDRGLLVIEVKGIGGTSTDKACSQVSKIKYRRAEQRGCFDVFGLYVVNHQRYMPPKSRANPPFTENQLNDARLECRGLLTTFELYKAYFRIEAGLLSKQDVIDSLYSSGLILMNPENLILLVKEPEIFKEGRVAVFELTDGASLNVGEFLVARKGDDMYLTMIKSIQVSDVDVVNAADCEVGVSLSVPIKKGAELFKRNV